MKKTKYFFFTLILSMLLAWTFGCSSTAVEKESPTQEPVEEAPTEAPLPPPTTTSEPEMVNHCLDCHTDKELLISTAKPEEEVISENEGAG